MWGKQYDDSVAKLQAKNFVWHFCTPKCASTHFMKHLQMATASNPAVGYARCIPMPKDRPQVVCTYTINHAIDDNPNTETIIGNRTHALATEDLTDIISSNHIVVIQTRSILDTIVSLFDHWNKNPRTPFWVTNQFFWPDLTDEEKYNHIIESYVPWHVQFVQGWDRASAKLNLIWTSYQNVVSDSNKVAEEIFSFHSINHNHVSVPREANGQFNVGRSGRGQKQLSEKQKMRVSELVDHFGGTWQKNRCSPLAELTL